MIKYQFEPINQELKPKQITELDRKISNSMPFLEKNFERLLNYLKKEEEFGNYIEINLPKTDSDLFFKLNLYKGKIIISVIKLSSKTQGETQEDEIIAFDPTKKSPNYEIVGHLLIDGFDCLGKEEIRKLGNFLIHKEKISRFKEFSE